MISSNTRQSDNVQSPTIIDKANLEKFDFNQKSIERFELGLDKTPSDDNHQQENLHTVETDEEEEFHDCVDDHQKVT